MTKHHVHIVSQVLEKAFLKYYFARRNKDMKCSLQVFSNHCANQNISDTMVSPRKLKVSLNLFSST